MKYFDVPGDAGHRLCCISLECPMLCVGEAALVLAGACVLCV